MNRRKRAKIKEIMAKTDNPIPFTLRYLLIVFCFMFFALSTLLFALSSEARVAGNCSNCHTMHNSQGGQPVARGDAPWGGTGGSTDARPSLLVASCLGCHSSVTSESIKEFDGNKIPIVFNTTGYPTNPLAGGNFFSVMTDDTKGHNIFTQDTHLSVAPGDPGLSGTCGNNTNCHQNLYAVSTVAGLEGKQGCEKCHLDPKHHANDHDSTGGLVTSAEQGWYRFLSGHSTGVDSGVEGYEDGDWQKTVSSDDHNEYLGSQISGGYGFVMLGNTTTAYCTGCHGRFHINQGKASPWLRHPSDAALPASGEYTNYTLYNPLVPVARSSLLSSPSPTVSSGDMVMCLSCHRAHASPYFKMMRWDYKAWPGTGGDGCDPSAGKHGCCNVCHTSKN